MTEFESLVQPIPREQFSGLSTTVEKRQLEFKNKKMKVDELATQCFEHADSLVEQLENMMRNTKEFGHSVSYTNTIRSDTWSIFVLKRILIVILLSLSLSHTHTHTQICTAGVV